MKFHLFNNSWLVAIALICLQGCATTSPVEANDAALRDLSADNLDLLFATEFPVASKEEALAKAKLAYREGEFDKAQLYLVRALKFDISDVDLLAQIGNLHIQQGNSQLAARAFQLALQQQPEHPASLEGMGLLYFSVGNDDKAKEHLELAVASAPNFWRSYNALGVIADRHQEFELARSYYDAALEIQPLADVVLINRGYSRFLDKDYEGAARDFYSVTERSNNKKAWRNLALVYATQGWYEDALETFLKVDDERDAYNATGAVAMQNGDVDEAYHYLSEAVRLSPTYFAKAEENLAQLRKQGSVSYMN